jgi:hypothetical protein
MGVWYGMKKEEEEKVNEAFEDIVGSLSDKKFERLTIEYLGYKPITKDAFRTAFSDMKQMFSKEEKFEQKEIERDWIGEARV